MSENNKRDAEENASQKKKEEELEEGLDETFPASDPTSVNQPTRTGDPKEDRKLKNE
ncbi:hypothetical protein [Pararhizobium mangrovi]|uniref:hypothetical protein n=1 Tax=Pararhizobium mangrovi TaxID=2590452 RepID=UPI0015E83B6A|nr:hypothetical protein [Pararhizobium mangrovi]